MANPRRVRPPVDHPVGLKPRGALTLVVWATKSILKTFAFRHLRAGSRDIGITLMVVSRLE